jgi:hypothetical protein
MKKHIICAEVKADLEPILSGIFSIEGKMACRKTLNERKSFRQHIASWEEVEREYSL